MRNWFSAVALLAVGAHATPAQQLSAADIVAIEKAAAVYVRPTLPSGVIGLEPAAFGRRGEAVSRARTRVDALLGALGARKVHTDSVLRCPGDPTTCTLGVAAVVRVGEPFASKEGARVWVNVLSRSGIARQPIGKLGKELFLSKKDGVWTVVGVGARNMS